MKNINFETVIYPDAVTMLLGKTDIRAMAEAQLEQGDASLEFVARKLFDQCREEGLDAEDIAERFGDTPVKKLMEYISIPEDSIELSYDETEACRDTGAAAFLIRCEFNAEKYLQDIAAEGKADAAADGDEAEAPISFDAYIYLDVYYMLWEKTNIREQVKSRVEQGDAFLEEISERLYDMCEEKDLDPEDVVERFEDETAEKLMEYISFKEEDVSFDYDESGECCNLRTVAFLIPCEFDAERYLKNLV